MLRGEGKGMQLIEEWQIRDVLILMSENSLFGIWYFVVRYLVVKIYEIIRQYSQLAIPRGLAAGIGAGRAE